MSSVSRGVRSGPVREVSAGREVSLGETTIVRRLLPTLGRRLVGPWCFVDHYGPDDISAGSGMAVPPHPHTGLQTVSWLLDGDVHHRDSIGSDQLILPGELGLMTAGRGIAHAEHSPTAHLPVLHGVQLWVALPDQTRDVAPSWHHHRQLPVFGDGGLLATVIMGELAGQVSPGLSYSPIVGADLALHPGARNALPLEPAFEHGVLVMSGSAQVDGVNVSEGQMIYLGTNRRELGIAAPGPARLLLLGGEPFDELIVMWWNLIARSSDEIADLREQWASGGARFGQVPDSGDRAPAPSLPPGRLKPRSRQAR